MKKTEKRFWTFLLILYLGFLTNAFPQTDSTVRITQDQLRGMVLTFDSLDECKEVSDSLRFQINNALQVIAISDTVINSLHQINFNQGEIIKGKDILLRDERQVSSSLRNKYRLWKLAAIILAGVNVYQVVK